jgi:hypothetical protein
MMRNKRYTANNKQRLNNNLHANNKIQNQTSMFPEDSSIDDELPTEQVIIQRDVTIDKLTEYYYDLVEAFKNGDPRIKATDYIKALSEIGRINKLYESKESDESKSATTISFTLG